MLNNLIVLTRTTGNKLLDSPIGQGILRLLNDGLFTIMIFGPIICGISAVIFTLKAGMSDDAEGPANKKKVKVALICAVLCVLVPLIIKVITSYFGISVEV